MWFLVLVLVFDVGEPKETIAGLVLVVLIVGEEREEEEKEKAQLRTKKVTTCPLIIMTDMSIDEKEEE